MSGQTKSPNVTYIFSDQAVEYNCSYWRAHVPYMGLKNAGAAVDIMYIDAFINRTPDSLEKLERADLIVFQRNVFDPVPQMMAAWIAKGKKFVVDLDDAYQHMRADCGVTSYEFWQSGIVRQADGKAVQVPVKPMDSLKWGLKIAGNISSPSQLICDDWAEYAKGYFIPNYYTPDFYRRHPVRKMQDKIYIGWGGSAGHIASWTQSGVMPALERIVKEFPQVVLYIVGDERVHAMFKKIPDSRKFLGGWVPGALWSKQLSYYDIGIVPLAGDYDRRRSCLKSMELSEMEVPWIGTDMEPNRFITGGILTQNTPDAWYEALKTMVTEYPERKAEARRNRDKTRENWSIQANTDNLIATFENIVEEN